MAVLEKQRPNLGANKLQTFHESNASFMYEYSAQWFPDHLCIYTWSI